MILVLRAQVGRREILVLLGRTVSRATLVPLVSLVLMETQVLLELEVNKETQVPQVLME